MLNKNLKLENKFIYCTVTLYMLQFVSCVCNVQLTTGVELYQLIDISFLGVSS
jgi:hypothetical protein